MKVTLTEPLRAFVTRRVQSGDKGNASESVRDLIRKDQEVQRGQALRALLEAGLASGPAAPFTPGDWDEFDAVARGDAE